MSADTWPIEGFAPIDLVDPFEIFVGPVFEQGAVGAKTFAIRVDGRHVNRRGILHGGMLLTLADLTHGQAVWDLTDKSPCVTLNMQSHFVRPAAEGDIVTITPQLVRRTRGLVFMRGDCIVRSETIFSASSVWKLLGHD